LESFRVQNGETNTFWLSQITLPNERFPMTNMKAKTVARILVNEIVSRFGVPEKVHSDQGRQFEGNVFKGMCELLQIVLLCGYQNPDSVTSLTSLTLLVCLSGKITA